MYIYTQIYIFFIQREIKKKEGRMSLGNLVWCVSLRAFFDSFKGFNKSQYINWIWQSMLQGT